jgi:hypothetical protein
VTTIAVHAPIPAPHHTQGGTTFSASKLTSKTGSVRAGRLRKTARPLLLFVCQHSAHTPDDVVRVVRRQLGHGESPGPPESAGMAAS